MYSCLPRYAGHARRGKVLELVVGQVTDLRCDLQTTFALAVALHDQLGRRDLTSVRWDVGFGDVDLVL